MSFLSGREEELMLQMKRKIFVIEGFPNINSGQQRIFLT